MIRQALAGDIPSILAMGRMFTAESPRFRQHAFNSRLARAVIEACLEQDGAWVAEVDGEALGYALAWAGPHVL